MATTITLGIQKGGCGKSITTGILTYLLTADNFKVLAIDMDSQGNLTELLSNRSANEFIGESILEAMQYNDAKKYTYPILDNLDLLPANNFLATLPRWLYTGKTYHGEKIPINLGQSLILDHLLDQVRNDYDFIIIDTPPALSEQTTNALCASDFVVVMYECSKWCYSAVPNFMESIDGAKNNGRRHTKPIGILRTMSDIRRNDAKAFNELIEEDYPDLVFKTIITRKASIGRLPLYGFNQNPELKQALKQYNAFYEELIFRVKD